MHFYIIGIILAAICVLAVAITDAISLYKAYGSYTFATIDLMGILLVSLASWVGIVIGILLYIDDRWGIPFLDRKIFTIKKKFLKDQQKP